MSDRLAIGARVELTEKGRELLAPKVGNRFGEITGELGDCWRVRWDGAAAGRLICKRYLQPET